MIARRRTENRLLAAPAALFLLVLLGFPTLLNVVYSLSEVSFETLRSPRLQGLANYGEVLGDPAFWGAASFSLRFGALTAAAEVALGLFLAVFLAPLLRARPWLLAPLTLPMMVAPAMMGLMYRLVLHEFVGPLPDLMLDLLGWAPAFLAPRNAFWTIAAIEVLQWTPFVILLVHMGYAAIPEEVREAARMDGARPWRMFRRIELPILAPTLAVAGLIRLIDGIRVFDNIYVLVGAGAGGATTSLPIYIYTAFFRGSTLGPALAASTILALAAFAVLAAALGLAGRRRP